MAATMTESAPAYARAAIESLTAEDFETASIRSAAPSYTSDAPSYHSTAPNPDPLPPYSPPARSAPAAIARPNANTSVSSLLPPEPGPPTPGTRRTGLPPVPSGPLPHQSSFSSSTTSLNSTSSPSSSSSDLPSLSQFRIPPWSATTNRNNNPTARIYHNVALRRASAASESAAAANLDSMMRRVMLERIEEEERTRIRPLEDPYLVGEEAAARARRERLARERAAGEEILVREDRRWDWFLAQMREREEREKNWKRFRRDMDRRSSRRLAFGIGARF